MLERNEIEKIVENFGNFLAQDDEFGIEFLKYDEYGLYNRYPRIEVYYKNGGGDTFGVNVASKRNLMRGIIEGIYGD